MRHVCFIEDKTPNWSRIAKLSQLSIEANRWTNFGPVAAALERLVGQITGLPENRTVVAASSATTALQALVGLRAARKGRRLRWVASAFGFFSTAIGPLAQDVHIVDCDRNGLLDLSQVDRLDANSWDGLIVTNTFGIANQLDVYAEYCRERGKELIVDSALALLGPDRSRFHDADEVISFHHTKPWGFGEGGCAIVSLKDGDLVRSFLNFGVGADSALAAFATNGKLSDIAAAAIFERLERLPFWANLYHQQRMRIVDLVDQAGLAVLGHPPLHAVCAHIPVLSPRPIAFSDMPDARFDVRKYYRALAPGMPVAEDLYARIVNIPCHPGMAEVSTTEIEAFLEAIRGSHSLSYK
jgi:dTDP-4-amino-4,6-dideoxygalactose transaminase